MNPPTHPRVFVIFGETKGEIRVKNGDFWIDLGGFGPIWESANPPTHISESFPQKKSFFGSPKAFEFYFGPKQYLVAFENYTGICLDIN